MCYHPVIGTWPTPMIKSMIPCGNRPWLLKTNSIGMRSDREYPVARPRGRRRAVLLGDSYAMGWGVDSRDRFSDLLEAKYPSLDVMNFARSGTGTDQQLLIYENIAKPFEADAYIFAPCTVDIARNMHQYLPAASPEEQIVYYSKPYFTLDKNRLILHNVPVPLWKTMSEKDAREDPEALSDLGTSPYTNRIMLLLPEWIRESDLFLRISVALRQPYRGYDSAESESWLLTRAIFERLINQVNGKPVFIVPLPTYHHVDMNLAPHYFARFAELHDPERNCFVIDVLPYFRRLSPENRKKCRLENDRMYHYSPEAHRVVADAISDALAKHCPDMLN